MRGVRAERSENPLPRHLMERSPTSLSGRCLDTHIVRFSNPYATLASHEKPIWKPRLRQFDAIQGDTEMRRDQQPIHEETKTTDYTFHFQISNGGGRQACSVKVEAPSIHEATRFFQQNWQNIELMARERLANRSYENGVTCEDREIRIAVA